MGQINCSVRDLIEGIHFCVDVRDNLGKEIDQLQTNQLPSKHTVMSSKLSVSLVCPIMLANAVIADVSSLDDFIIHHFSTRQFGMISNLF